MRTNRLGNTGLLVSELCLGAMTFGAHENSPTAHIGSLSQDETNVLVRMSVNAGINFIDTADAYARGQSEVVTGQALRELGIPRNEMVIATKGFGAMGPGPNNRGNSRAHLLDAAHASLRRLQTDYIDLYQIHGFDPVTPIEESVRALDTLVQQGAVRYVGVSNWACWQLMKALGLADRHGLARFCALQAYYSIAGRDLERELAPMMLSEGVGLLVWSPLAGGLLSGKYRREPAAEGRATRRNVQFPPVDAARADAVMDAMEPVARARGVSMAQIAIAWLLHQPVVTSVIIGATRPDQLADNLGAPDVSLTTAELEALDAASALPSEYPGWMLDFMRAMREAPDPHAAARRLS